MQRYRATVEYDGTEYFGFQRQIDAQVTVQSEIEAALNRVRPDTHTTITGAGRTDRGVHATGQVISFELDWPHGTETLQKALNANLPSAIAVREVAVASEGFHPRFSAKSRCYQYTIYNGLIRRPLLENRVWHIPYDLDVSLMNEAAALLVGEHDFATFGTPPQGVNTVRNVFGARWKRDEEFLTFDIEATAFLKRMVRSIVGCLKTVGAGAWSIEEFQKVMVSAQRANCAAAAPPQGLVLTKVKY